MMTGKLNLKQTKCFTFTDKTYDKTQLCESSKNLIT